MGAAVLVAGAWSAAVVDGAWSAAVAAESDASPAPGLRAQLRALAAETGVALKGLERIGAASAREPEGDSPTGKIESLLYGYNYLLIHDSNGRIAEVRILGARPTAPARPARMSVLAVRRGAHLEVGAVLVGPRGGWRRRDLIVDTGASTVVLPASMIPRLGFVEGDLTPTRAETAGGPVAARAGRLTKVTVGQAVVRDVEVIFIEDARLGGSALLGMSFLGRFRVTVDDAANRITLIAK